MGNPSTEKTKDRENGTPAVQTERKLKEPGSEPLKPDFQVDREHNYYTIRLNTEAVSPQMKQIEGIIALSKVKEKIFRNKLMANGFILGESKLLLNDPRVIRLAMGGK